MCIQSECRRVQFCYFKLKSLIKKTAYWLYAAVGPRAQYSKKNEDKSQWIILSRLYTYTYIKLPREQ